MIIELHMLQNFAPSCLNRDDTGAPKECQFGGFRRARISSQCIKRAIRDYFKDKHLFPDEQLAYRTQLIKEKLINNLTLEGKNADQAEIAVNKALDCLKLKTENNQTKYLVFLGEQEIKAITSTILKYWDMLSGNQSSKEFEKEILSVLDGGKAVDLALFGRMLADLPKKNIDAACQVAHAVSTNKINIEFDYFTAIDDLQPAEKTGAVMLGSLEFDSACYYRYANIDLEQLEKNLKGDSLLVDQAWKAFLKAAVNAVPSGKQTTFSAQNPPDFVFAVVREYGAWSLANAFVKPVDPNKEGDLIQESALSLINYWNKLIRAYGTEGIKTKAVLSLVDVPLDGLEKAENLEDLITAVGKGLTN